MGDLRRCICPDPDAGLFELQCPEHIVFSLGTSAELEAAIAAQRAFDAELREMDVE